MVDSATPPPPPPPPPQLQPSARQALTPANASPPLKKGESETTLEGKAIAGAAKAVVETVPGLSKVKEPEGTPHPTAAKAGKHLSSSSQIPGWSTVEAAMSWAQNPSNAAAVVAATSCVVGLGLALVLGRGGASRRRL